MKIMMKKLFILAVLMLAVATTQAQKHHGVYAIGFYNLENLFDYTHDEGKKDEDFLPTGRYQWNQTKYKWKLRNLSRVLSEMGTEVLPKQGCALIGVAEVENDHCMSDLVAQEPLKKRGYRYVHIEGPDHRGIDCALIYNPKLFKVDDAKLLPYIYDLPADSLRATRGFLAVTGTLAKDRVMVIVCHWPSRGAGSYYRELAAKQVKAIKDSILHHDAERKVIVMGDMNDDPTNRSMHDVLLAKGEIEEVGTDGMYNPWYNVLVKEQTGTLRFRGAWNLFDQIALTPNLVAQPSNKSRKGLRYLSHEVFRRDYLLQTEGKWEGYPKRTTAGGVWINGYSDHLPVVVYLTTK